MTYKTGSIATVCPRCAQTCPTISKQGNLVRSLQERIKEVGKVACSLWRTNSQLCDRRSGRLSAQRLKCPVPWKQLLQPGDRRVRDAGENVSKPCLRIDAVELCRHHQRGHIYAITRARRTTRPEAVVAYDQKSRETQPQFHSPKFVATQMVA